MTDFNLEQFKAGILVFHSKRDCYLRYVGRLNSADGKWIICAITSGGCSFESSIALLSIGELEGYKMKPEKKKLYIAIRNARMKLENSGKFFYHPSQAYESKEDCETLGIPDCQIVEVEIEV